MSPRALIVEDEPLIAMSLEETLRRLGLEVCGQASNPQEAVEIASSRRPDLVLMDVYLKEDCEGIKAAKWLRDACDIPVLFVTGHGDPNTLARIRALLPEAPLCAKPIDADRLAEAISRATGWDVPVSATSC